MKISLMNLLRGGVFLLAVIAAFAFTQPMDTSQTYWGDDPIQGPVQVEFGSSEYSCDSNPSEQCLYHDEALTNPVAGSQGEFELN